MQIYLDCTNTFGSLANTGIQRVVRNVVTEAAFASAATGIPAQSVVFKGSAFRRAKLVFHMGLSGRYLLFLQKVRAIAQRFFRPFRGWAWFEFLVRHLRPIIKRVLLKPLEWVDRPVGRRVEMAAGDLLILLDASWNSTPDLWQHIAHLKLRGVKIVTVVYDIIPITHPRYMPWVLVDNFKTWFRNVLELSDGFLCISEATRAELMREVARRGRQAQFHGGTVQVIPLGFSIETLTGGPLRAEIRELVNRAPADLPYLVVGTFEPRKNHAFVLDVFESLWIRHPHAELWLVGAPGWLTEGLMDRLRTHPEQGRNVRVFHNATDGELDFLYRHAKAMIAASSVEGYGLPVVEALSRGCRVFASDIPPFRETAGDSADYFRLEERTSLAALIDAAEAPPALATQQVAIRQLATPETYRGIDWSQAAIAFLNKAAAMFGLQPQETADVPSPSGTPPTIAALEQRIAQLERQLAQYTGVQTPAPAATVASKPRVSVVTPVYNRPVAVVEAIASVQRQTFQEWELLVVDDGSTDGSAAAVTSTLADPRIRLLRQDNGGPSSARNLALQHAQGDIVAYLDSDNLWFPDYLARVVVSFDADPNQESAYGILVTDHHAWISPGQVNQPFDREKLLAGELCIDINVFSHRRALYERLGGFDPAIERVEDWDLVLRYTADSVPKQLNVPSTQYRRVDQQAMTVSSPYGPNRFLVTRKWIGLGRDAPPLRVLYVLYDYPQLSSSYVENEIHCMRRWGVTVEVWSVTEGGSPLPTTLPVHRGRLADAIRDARPDVLHVHWLSMTTDYAADLAASGLPITVRAHGYDVDHITLGAVLGLRQVRRVFCFPHQMGNLAENSRLHPVAVGFDTTQYQPERKKNRRMVLRAAAGLAGKNIELFIDVAKRLPDFQFVLALVTIKDHESYLDRIDHLWREARLPGEVLRDVPPHEMAPLVHQAGISLYTTHPPEHPSGTPLGMPVSIAEAMATGAHILVPSLGPMVGMVGPAGRAYRNAAHAAELIRETATWSEEQWRQAWTHSVDLAFVDHADEIVYRPILEEWRGLVNERGTAIAVASPVSAEPSRLVATGD